MVYKMPRLQDALMAALVDKRARDAPLCPVREQLFSEAFDEVRQRTHLDTLAAGLIGLFP